MAAVQTTDTRTLDRYLTQLDVWAIAFGCIVGWGAFVMPGTTFLPLAGPGGTIIGMVASVAIMLIVGANYGYLMVHRPGTGGIYTYAKEVFGRDHAFICSWFLTLSYTSIVFLNATALFVVTRTLFGSMLQVGLHYQVAGYDVYLGEVALSAVALVVVGFILITRKPLIQHLQTTLAVTLLLGSVALSVICLPHLDMATALTTDGIGTHTSLSAVTTIVLLSPWAYVGFDVISLETAHFAFPIKHSGKLIALSIIAGGFTYTALSLVGVTAVPPSFSSWQEYLVALDGLSGIDAVPTFYAPKAFAGTFGVVLAGVTALAAIGTGIIGAYRATTRMLSTMAEDRIVPDSFASTTVSILFIMVISITVSFLGRNALNWFVELTTFGAIVGFGYTSLCAWHFARREGSPLVQATGGLGFLITSAFAVVQMIPKLTVFQTMGPESFLMLALWCLIGFVFYWKTMIQTTLTEHSGYFVSSTVLFSLLLYAALMWYVLRLARHEETAPLHFELIVSTIILLALVLVGLLVMLYVQNMLHAHQKDLERDMIHAEESSRAKSQFLFNMSHDIRTPMNAVIGLTTLARAPGVTSAQKDEYLEQIQSSGQQLLNIINDVLDMSRIESGKLELVPEPADLTGVVDELSTLFALQMERKGVAFSVDASEVSDRWALCDRNRLNRVLLNLLSNAYKFTPEGGSVALTLRQTGRHGKMASYELSVSDTGIGMSPAFVEEMFTPFERERTSTVSGIQGTGLGLAITKSIVDLMGGSIDVRTAPGEGSTFIISLDLPVAEAPARAADGTQGSGASGIAGARLLLAEDVAVNRQIAQLILEQSGCTVDSVQNGREALELLQAVGPGYYDAVLMDIQMPVMDGYEAMRAIRALDDPQIANVPIIAMTANAFAEDVRAAHEAGMQAHVAKPIEVDKLLGAIASVLGER